MAEGRGGGQVAEEVPDDRPSQSPSQAPRGVYMQVLIGGHCRHRGTAKDALSFVNSSIQERLQEHCEISCRAMHSAPGMSHIAPVRAIWTEPLGVVRIRIG